MQKWRSAKNSQWWLPVLSGILIGTSYIPFPPWASLFCFVPLWLFWQRQSTLGKVVQGGMLTSLIYTLIGFNWIIYTLHEFAKVNWFIAGLGLLLFALFGHLFTPLAGMAWFLCRKYLRNSPRLSFALMAVWTALAEHYVPMLFKWNFGYSWYGSGIPIYQWAEIIGFSGLSMLTILANFGFLLVWQNRRCRIGQVGFLVALSVFLGLNLGGLWLKNRLPEPDTEVRALMVQANIGNLEKMAMEHGKGYRVDILNKYLQLTDEGLAQNQGIDFVLWSETAFPAFLGGKYNRSSYGLAVKEFLRARQVSLITGAYAWDEDKDLPTNSIFFIDEDGGVKEPHYSKTHLLAFGEYLPGEETFSWLRAVLPMVGRFSRGPGPSVLLRGHDYAIGPQVCYESLFPDFSKGLANLGAQFIVNVTNDSWYGTWQEPYQHLYMTLARGVEFRRPVLRVTNTGISTAALADGEVLAFSPLNASWTGVYRIAYRAQPQETFYQRHFYLMPALLWSSLTVLLICGFLQKYRNIYVE